MQHTDTDDSPSPLIDVVLPDMAAGQPEHALHNLASMISPYISVDTRIVEQRLLALEKQEGSGIGNGVALPHLRLSGADRAIAVFARNRHWLDFHTVDATPVDLLCMLVSPAEHGADHLRRLSRLTRILRDHTMLDRLRAAEDRDVVEMILASDHTGHMHAA